MRITVDVPEGIFREPKTAEQVASDLRQAAAMFWLARGEVAPDGAVAIATGKTQSLMDLLLSMSDVGEDADFKRSAELPREPPEWAS